MKKLIDANVILRYLLADDVKAAEKAKETIENGAFTIGEVIAEVVYVLKGVYGVDRKEIAETLTCFLHEIDMIDRDVLLYAFSVYADTKLDYVDCLLIAYNRLSGVEVLSFDKKLNAKLNF